MASPSRRKLIVFALLAAFVTVLALTSMSSMSSGGHRMPDGSVMEGGSMPAGPRGGGSGAADR